MKLFPILLLSSWGVSALAADPPNFADDVRPVLERHCIGCHSGWFPDAGVDLDDLDGIRKGGPSGPLIVPGKPDKGWLTYTITRGKGRQRMPPQGPGPNAEERDLLRRWIAAGAR